MSSGTFIILSALKRIGANSLAQPASPEAVVEGRDVLNSMLQLWLSENIDLGIVPLDAPGDELGEPLDSRNAIIDNLALRLSPLFDNGNNVVSPQLASNAKREFGLIRNLYQVVDVPLKVVSSTLPVGSGNKTGLARQRIFKGIGGTVNG
jgi:hypothetical protein